MFGIDKPSIPYKTLHKRFILYILYFVYHIILYQPELTLDMVLISKPLQFYVDFMYYQYRRDEIEVKFDIDGQNKHAQKILMLEAKFLSTSITQKWSASSS